MGALIKLVHLCVEAYVASAHLKPRARGRGFVSAADAILRDRALVVPLYPLRPQSRRAVDAEAWRQADAMYRDMRPNLLARLPPP